MFRELWQEISNKLGADFVVYYNEDVSDNRQLTARLGQTVGVFRVTSGSIQPIKGDSGLQANVTIDFFAKVEDNAEVIKIDNAIDKLVSENNGVIVVESALFSEGETTAENEMFRYICNYNPPVVIGNTQIGPDSDRYIIKQLTFSVVLTSSLVFGDSGICYLSETEITEGNKAAALIPGVIRWALNSQTYTADNTEINETHVTSIPINAAVKPVISGLAKKNDAFVNIMKTALQSPQTKFFFRLEFLDESFNYAVTIDRFLTTGVLSDFVSYELALSEIPSWL